METATVAGREMFRLESGGREGVIVGFEYRTEVLHGGSNTGLETSQPPRAEKTNACERAVRMAGVCNVPLLLRAAVTTKCPMVMMVGGRDRVG